LKQEKRSNETRASTSDPDAKLCRKGDGQPARLCYKGHTLMENRYGLLVDARLTLATGTAEREAALEMLDRRRRSRRITLGADKGYDVKAFIGELRARRGSPHIAVNGAVSKTGKVRKTSVDGRAARHASYGISQRIEEGFGWMKSIAGQRQTKLRGRERVAWSFTFSAAAYNLERLSRLLGAAS
jgi:hypothetical protein